MNTPTTTAIRLLTIFLFLIISTQLFVTSTTSALGENNLYLVYYDCETQEQLHENTETFYEGCSYDIEVGGLGEIGYIYDVTITTPWGSFKTTRETPWITITIPPYDEYEEGFILTARKNGYNTLEEHAQIIKGNLIITLDRGIVNEGESFKLTVTDQNNQIISDVDVYLESYGQKIGHAITNAEGAAFIVAPSIEETTDIIVRAFRIGYQPASATIHIENTAEFIFSEQIPLLVAFLILLSSIIIVQLRKRKYKQLKPTRTTRKLHTTTHRHVPKTPQPTQNSKRIIDPNAVTVARQTVKQRSSRVEEIRIHASEKKHITNYVSPKHKPESTSSNDPNKWLEGTNNVKYKIDELTGEIDPNKKDKWFEGVDNIKDKVDKKLKKNYKQKDT